MHQVHYGCTGAGDIFKRVVVFGCIRNGLLGGRGAGPSYNGADDQGDDEEGEEDGEDRVEGVDGEGGWHFVFALRERRPYGV